MLARGGRAAPLSLRRTFEGLTRRRSWVQACACRTLVCNDTTRPRRPARRGHSADLALRSTGIYDAESIRWHSTAAALMPPPPVSGRLVPFNLADIGEGIAEVEMMQWFVKEGDSVKQFDRLCEVQSDKATVEISSRYDGIVRNIHHAVGSIVKVGTPLVDIEVFDGDSPPLPTINNRGPPPPLPQQQASTPPLAPPPPPPAPMAPPPPVMSAPPLSAPVVPPLPAQGGVVDGGGIVLTTPAVRRLAKENGIDLSQVRGTGPQGRVLKGDVLEFLRHRDAALALGAPPLGGAVIPPVSSSPFMPPPPPPAPLLPSFPASPQPVSPTPALGPPTPSLSSSMPAVVPLVQPTRVPIRGVMRQMIKSMTASLKIPHFGYQDEVLADELMVLRDSLKPAAKAQGIKLTFLPIMVKAASLSLLHYPLLNSSLSSCERELVYHSDHNIGVAMDTAKGLLVPVIKRVQDKSILQIAKELTELQHLGATGSFTEEHLTGATFSISNIGSIGGTYMDPVIVPPQVAIGAVGRIQKLPRFGKDGSVVPVHVMAVSWSGDHRVIDGATMARFSNHWKGLLENPQLMLASTR